MTSRKETRKSRKKIGNSRNKYRSPRVHYRSFPVLPTRTQSPSVLSAWSRKRANPSPPFDTEPVRARRARPVGERRRPKKSGANLLQATLSNVSQRSAGVYFFLDFHAPGAVVRRQTKDCTVRRKSRPSWTTEVTHYVSHSRYVSIPLRQLFCEFSVASRALVCYTSCARLTRFVVIG